MERSDIKVKGDRFDLFDDAYNGRLVKVTGTLRYSWGATSRFSDQPSYFYIEPDSCEVVERVRWTSLTTEDDASIQPISITELSLQKK